MFSLPRYEYISGCKNSIEGCFGCQNLNFTCSDSNKESNLFKAGSDVIGCDGDFYRTRYGSISFKNCFFRKIKRNFFEIFVNLHTFNISDVGLEILQLKTFRNAGNLTTLLASNNNLTELTAHLFLDAENLTSVDFSYNKIYRVDPLVFHDVKALRTVNLSHNPIEKLDWNSLSSSSLVTVDLSHNNLTSLNGPIFEAFKFVIQSDWKFEHRYISLFTEFGIFEFKAHKHIRHSIGNTFASTQTGVSRFERN